MSGILVITPFSILHRHLYYYSMENNMMVDNRCGVELGL